METILALQLADGQHYIVGEGNIKSIELGSTRINRGHFIIKYDDHLDVINARYVVSYTIKGE